MAHTTPMKRSPKSARSGAHSMRIHSRIARSVHVNFHPWENCRRWRLSFFTFRRTPAFAQSSSAGSSDSLEGQSYAGIGGSTSPDAFADAAADAAADADADVDADVDAD